MMVILYISLGAIVIGCLLGFAAFYLKEESDPIVDKIDATLPQTQCGQCGYPGCHPYAEAIAKGAPINKCPPGGQSTINKLADLMGVSAPAPVKVTKPLVAIINPDECIGCTKCIQACPVDAIIGSNKLMHTIVYDNCTGCNLCVNPCPVDCISMVPKNEIKSWNWKQNAIIIQRVEDNT